MSKAKKAASAAKLHKDKMACNKPKKTPGHKTKSHVVKACENGKEKIIRFGQQGVKGAGKNPKTAKDKARKKSYYARHNAQDSSPYYYRDGKLFRTTSRYRWKAHTRVGYY